MVLAASPSTPSTDGGFVQPQRNRMTINLFDQGDAFTRVRAIAMPRGWLRDAVLGEAT
jgi:hypothetical protein